MQVACAHQAAVPVGHLVLLRSSLLHAVAMKVTLCMQHLCFVNAHPPAYPMFTHAVLSIGVPFTR